MIAALWFLGLSLDRGIRAVGALFLRAHHALLAAALAPTRRSEKGNRPPPQRSIPLWRRAAARVRLWSGRPTLAPDRPLRPSEGGKLLRRALDETAVLVDDLGDAVERRIAEREEAAR